MQNYQVFFRGIRTANSIRISVKGSVPNLSDPLADEILQYLVEHPEAKDTIDGIADWWLTERRVRQGIAEVGVALQLLIDRGWIEVVWARDGKKHYALKSEKKQADRRNPSGSESLGLS